MAQRLANEAAAEQDVNACRAPGFTQVQCQPIEGADDAENRDSNPDQALYETSKASEEQKVQQDARRYGKEAVNNGWDDHRVQARIMAGLVRTGVFLLRPPGFQPQPAQHDTVAAFL